MPKFNVSFLQSGTINEKTFLSDSLEVFYEAVIPLRQERPAISERPRARCSRAASPLPTGHGAPGSLSALDAAAELE